MRSDTIVTASTAARVLGCTVEQARAQYAKNAAQLDRLASEAEASPAGMVNGWTAQKWRSLAAAARKSAET